MSIGGVNSYSSEVRVEARKIHLKVPHVHRLVQNRLPGNLREGLEREGR